MLPFQSDRYSHTATHVVLAHRRWSNPSDFRVRMVCEPHSHRSFQKSWWESHYSHMWASKTRRCTSTLEHLPCCSARTKTESHGKSANQQIKLWQIKASCRKHETTWLSLRPLPFKCMAVADVSTSDGEKAIAPPKAGFQCDGPWSKLILRHVSSAKRLARNGFWLASRDFNRFWIS